LDRKHYFEEKSETWDKEVFHDPEKLEHIINQLHLKPGDNVLDVASGTGVLIPYIFRKIKLKGKISIVDFSEQMISISKKKHPEEEYPNLEFNAQEIMKINLRPEYDAIICYSCFPHFPNKFTLLKHLYNGLKLGGRLIIAHSESRKKINKHHKKLKNSVVVHDMLPPMDKIENMMKNVGFKIGKTLDNQEMFYIISIK
jgi:demethylmenaquinone methyltransferase/2-methoxy-6-polyprenyl-1,4-benzoquinol methylase